MLPFEARFDSEFEYPLTRVPGKQQLGATTPATESKFHQRERNKCKPLVGAICTISDYLTRIFVVALSSYWP